jgi:Beta protein
MATPIYVPILKGKEGEYAALEVLTDDVRPSLMPLIEVPRIQYDFENKRPAKSLDDHISGIPERLSKCLHQGPLFLDLHKSGNNERLNGGGLAIDAVLAECTRIGIQVVPVVSHSSSPEYLAAAGRHSTLSGHGCCLRLFVGDFEEDIDPEVEAQRVLEGTDSAAESVDLLIDLGDLGSDVSRALLVTRSIFSMLPKRNWRRIILAAASFPEDLSDVSAADTATLPRHEWDLWRALQKRPNILPRRDLIFGDYAISHPISKELDPRTMRMSANIRYTGRENWLVVKGRNVRQYGFEQYFDLCRTLVKRPEYCGRDYSWGDEYIAECASNSKGPGNATTWRKVGVNHHLTLIVREIANLHGAA